ncbi:MAG: T9SS type A sorting domain-containing protein [Flavobacteriales bacterium]|nr:T9SS type A sorting domain-containing protein [Flavobacteriales bacterium]MBP6698766.1 T9SS type A sorting domain-containing protein [Flavobacteriales bacterium]
MEHGTHPSPRQPLFATVASAALALLLFAAYLTPLSSAAQNPFAHKGLCDTNPVAQPCGANAYNYNTCGQIYFYPYPGGITTTLSLTDTTLYTETPEYTDTCRAPFKFSWSLHDAPLGNSSGTDVSKYPTMRGGAEPHTFYIKFGRQTTTWTEKDWLLLSRFPNDINIYWSATQRALSWDLFVDGVQSGTVELVPGTQEWAYPGYNTYDGHPYLYVRGVWKVTYTPGSAYGLPNNVREFALRPKILYTIGGVPATSIASEEFRFKAVMVGTSFTDVLGTFDTPDAAVQILRDPPGDASFTSLTSSNTMCRGETISGTTEQGGSAFAKVRIGIAGSAGLIVSTNFEIYGEVGVSTSASRTRTSTGDYLTCLTAGQTISTPTSGAPDDLFFGSSVRYAYGMALTTRRIGCNMPTDSAEFMIVPIQTLSNFRWPESYIRSTVVPELEADVASLVVGTEGWKVANNQLNVWRQTLAMNDSIKANANYTGTLEQFTSLGGFVDSYVETTSSQTRAIDYNVSLSQGLSAEFGVNFGGSGVTVGGEVTFRQEYGKTVTSSNDSINRLDYHLEDLGNGDNFDVEIRQDKVLGGNVYRLRSTSKTSCPYEGGYQLDQPLLLVGGGSQMLLNQVLTPQATFPITVANNSNYERTYSFFVNGTTNPGVTLSGYGGINPITPVSLTIAANTTFTGNIVVGPPIGTDSIADLEIILADNCDGGQEIQSSISLSAYFGEGNFGGYCIPSSAVGTADGDWIDGVRIGSINNTGTGGVAGPTYTNYSAQYSTPLSRNAQKIITITSGANAGVRFAAWIDYDRDGMFEASEKLGEFENSAASETQNIAFTVPMSAQVGSTIMRVRGVHYATGEPTPVDPCYSYQAGETEDYGVVINANTPQDCAGVNNGPALPGTACNDGNANTGNDTWNANCTCLGQPLDCVGVPNGQTLPGIACNDGNANTAGDVYDANCQCAGLPLDCLGVPGGTTVQGTACDDGDAATGNDVYNASCQCAGQLIDCLGVIGGTTTVGTPCDDGNPLSGGDAYAANCECVGAFANDCAGVAGGTAQPGTACDDNDGTTGNDTYSVNCVCAGEVYDCAGLAGGPQLPGTPCDDGNPDSTNDTFTAGCGCIGEFADDCAGVPGGTALPGTPCNDGNADTGNDVYDAFCTCAGQPIDCNGVVGGPTQPGFPCDDGNASTGGDVIDANCQCAGLLLDCLGVPGGTTTVGTPCDDDDANTGNDVYTANCICAGELANDCEGVAGGSAQPGTTCDDGDATTGNDVYGANCECAGEVIDCEGIAGGPVLPGTPCNDGDNCTTNDVRGTDCACSGTTITIGAVTGSTMVFGNTTNVYLVTPVANATSYNWTLPNGWTTSDNGAFALVAGVNNIAGPVELCVTAMVGDCELTSCITVNVDFNTGIATTNASSEDWFTVQPNPSNGMFQLRPSTTDATPLRISIRNGLGQEVLAPFTVAGQRTIDMDLSDVAAGAYYLLATRNGEQQVIKIMVQR